MRFLNKILILCLVFALIGALVNCSKEETPKLAVIPEKKPSVPPPVITLGYVGHDHQIALYIATIEGERFKKGLFSKVSTRF